MKFVFPIRSTRLTFDFHHNKSIHDTMKNNFQFLLCWTFYRMINRIERMDAISTYYTHFSRIFSTFSKLHSRLLNSGQSIQNLLLKWNFFQFEFRFFQIIKFFKTFCSLNYFWISHRKCFSILLLIKFKLKCITNSITLIITPGLRQWITSICRARQNHWKWFIWRVVVDHHNAHQFNIKLIVARDAWQYWNSTSLHQV